jgi:hypothetical protein
MACAFPSVSHHPLIIVGLMIEPSLLLIALLLPQSVLVAPWEEALMNSKRGSAGSAFTLTGAQQLDCDVRCVLSFFTSRLRGSARESLQVNMPSSCVSMSARVMREQRLQQIALLLSLERLVDVQVPPVEVAGRGCGVCCDACGLQEYWGPLSGVAWKISADEVCLLSLAATKLFPVFCACQCVTALGAGAPRARVEERLCPRARASAEAVMPKRRLMGINAAQRVLTATRRKMVSEMRK